MSGDQNIWKLAQSLEQLYAKFHEEGRALEDSVAEASQAIEIYREFRRHVDNSRFEVKTIETLGNGAYAEVPFQMLGNDSNL